MKHFLKNTSVFVLLLLLLNSCATIFLGTEQYVTLTTKPQGADIYINGKNSYKQTPHKLVISKNNPESQYNRKNEIVYTFKKDGYYDFDFRDKSKVHWLAYVDYYFYVVPGLINTITKAHRKFRENIHIDLYVVDDKDIKDTDRVTQVNHQAHTQISRPRETQISTNKSDVAINIPINAQTNDMTFVVIIANENYRRESDVPFAINDGKTFKEYCERTLGIVSTNIKYIENATFGEMRAEINWLKSVIQAFGGEAKVIFYFAGHGMPDDIERKAYMLPVDGFSTDYESAIGLEFLYTSLTEYPTQWVVVFLDACFSGASRDDIMLATESGQRAVRIRPRENTLNGNIVVISGATGEQTAFPYKEKQHGMFTYYLLKKLQQTEGNANLNSLTDYIITNVSRQSIIINNKSQVPQVNHSPQMKEKWKNINFVK